MNAELRSDTTYYSTTGIQFIEPAGGVLSDDALIASRDTQGDLEVDWQADAIRAKMQDLLDRLEDGWDSYGASAPQRHLFDAGLRLIEGLLHTDIAAPDVIPTNKGGVQFEWSVGSRELEIEVVGADRFEVFFEDETTGETVEDEVTSRKLDVLSALVNKLKLAV
jgi:hypothetical protein